MAFIQKKVVVIELNGVDTVLLLEDREDFGSALRCLSFLTAIENRNYPAELAAERATDAGMVHRGAAAQESGQQVALDGPKLVIWKPRKVVRGTQRPFRIVNVKGEVVLEGKSFDARKLS